MKRMILSLVATLVVAVGLIPTAGATGGPPPPPNHPACEGVLVKSVELGFGTLKVTTDEGITVEREAFVNDTWAWSYTGPLVVTDVWVKSSTEHVSWPTTPGEVTGPLVDDDKPWKGRRDISHMDFCLERPAQPDPEQRSEPSTDVDCDADTVTTTTRRWETPYEWDDEDGWVLGAEVELTPIVDVTEADDEQCPPPPPPDPCPYEGLGGYTVDDEECVPPTTPTTTPPTTTPPTTTPPTTAPPQEPPVTTTTAPPVTTTAPPVAPPPAPPSAPTPSPTPTAAETLPVTGSSTGLLLAGAAVLLTVGLGAVLATRRTA